MAVIADRVQETTTTTGTGTLTLAGAEPNFQGFNDAFTNGDLVPYVIVDEANEAWEAGYGTVGTGTLSRDTVTASSNSNALVNLAAGTKSIFCDATADYINNRPTIYNEVLEEGTDFDAGTDTSVTLAREYGNEVNIHVFFDAAWQGPDTYSLSGTTLTFDDTIPADVQKIYVKGVATVAASPVVEAFKVGAIYISVDSTNPGTTLGYGTWVTFAAGRVLVGVDAGDPDFDTVEATGGEKEHTLTVDEMPSHAHKTSNTTSYSPSESITLRIGAAAAASNNTYTSEVGGGQAHNNLQPYIAVYMWKRTA